MHTYVAHSSGTRKWPAGGLGLGLGLGLRMKGPPGSQGMPWRFRSPSTAVWTPAGGIGPREPGLGSVPGKIVPGTSSLT